MPDALRIKKKELALKKLQLAKDEMDVKILERLDEVERIKESIVIQEQAIEDLKQELVEIKKP